MTQILFPRGTAYVLSLCTMQTKVSTGLLFIISSSCQNETSTVDAKSREELVYILPFLVEAKIKGRSGRIV